ncbi:MAG: GxxExxY protein [Verrucomicrobiota bacterium]|nr:GxxExxY protein [Verrucomicrobiota bacterium]
METDYALTEKVIGVAMKVHRALGPGFLESVYRNAFAFELRRAGLPIDLDQHITVRYESVIVGDFVADIIISDTLLCELKAISALSKADEVQLVNYLTATHHDVGLLLNFGAPSLQFKRKLRRLGSDPSSVDLHNPVNPVNPV